jgi:DNA polymerase III alpha subunit
MSTYAKNIQSSVADGQTDIFGVLGEDSAPALKLAKVAAASLSQRLRWEKEYLGLYVSGHPLQGLKSHFMGRGKLIGNLTKKNYGKSLKISGLVSNYKRVMTKSGKYMCFGEIEDPTARVPFVLFPRNYDRFGEFVELDRILCFEGKFDKRGDDPQMIVDKVTPISLEKMIESAKEAKVFDEEDKIIGVPKLEFEDEPELIKDNKKDENYVIKLRADSDPKILHKLRPLLEENKGDINVEIHLPAGDKMKRIKVPFGVRVDKELKLELEKIVA